MRRLHGKERRVVRLLASCRRSAWPTRPAIVPHERWEAGVYRNPISVFSISMTQRGDNVFPECNVFPEYIVTPAPSSDTVHVIRLLEGHQLFFIFPAALQPARRDQGAVRRVRRF